MSASIDFEITTWWQDRYVC